MEDRPGDPTLRMTTEIVVAFLGTGSVTPEKLPGLVLAVRQALSSDGARASEAAAALLAQSAPEEVEEALAGGEAQANPPFVSETENPPPSSAAPAVPVGQSITHDYLISLEDGQRYRSLKRHLMTRYGLTPEAYRAKWGLPRDYPMVAPSYAEARSRVAKESGLGQPKQQPAAAGAQNGVGKAARNGSGPAPARLPKK
jgi:predicted transcriptional regulator